tara:strand:- start:206 stop:598 length:393 start_codon:yes stop_codon:yes gene_type:complete
MLTYFLWFLAGALTHKALNYILSLGYERLLIEESLSQVARIYKAIDADVTSAVLFKHKNLLKSDLDRKIINDILAGDKEFLVKWKSTLFINVVAVVPPKYLKKLPHFLFDKNANLDEVITKLEERKRDEH